MTTLDADLQKTLQNALGIYVQQYGGESIDEIRAIAGAILASREKAGALISQGLEIENWVDALVQDFDFSKIVAQGWDEAERAIATQAKHWRETLEVKARATLDAYIQKYVPSMDTTHIQSLIATILPIVEDTKISRDEAKRLMQTISSDFDWQSALERVIDPRWVFFAEKTMQVIQHHEVEGSVQDVMQAYVQKFQPTAVEIGEALVEQAVQAVTNSQVKLGLDVELDPETQRLLVKQVVFKLNLLEASPPPSKTALEIAQQVQAEIARYRQQQGLNTVNYQPPVHRTDDATSTSSLLGGEMSVGYDLKSHPPREASTPDRSDTSAHKQNID